MIAISLRRFSLDYPNKLLADEYINSLISEFDKDGVEDRQLEHRRTIEFVDSRSAFLSSELEIIENRRQITKEGEIIFLKFHQWQKLLPSQKINI